MSLEPCEIRPMQILSTSLSVLHRIVQRFKLKLAETSSTKKINDLKENKDIGEEKRGTLGMLITTSLTRKKNNPQSFSPQVSANLTFIWL